MPVARRLVGLLLGVWGVANDVAATAELIMSELVTNAVRHGAAPIRLRLGHDHTGLVLAVADAGIDLPRPRPMATLSVLPSDLDDMHEQGWGLHLVEALARSWSVTPSASGRGKTVTVVLELPMSASGTPSASNAGAAR